MNRFSHLSRLALLILALAACVKAQAPPAPAPALAPAQTPAQAPASKLGAPEQLARIVERYWDERIPAEDAIDPQVMADSLNIERRYLAQIAALPRDSLDAAGRLNMDIFKRQRESIIEGFTFPGELMPLNPFGGPLIRLALESEVAEQHPFSAPADYDRWRQRIESCVSWSQRAIINMRDGLRRGYTSPRSVAARMLPLLERLGADNSGNVFYLPLRSMPDSIAAGERARITKSLNEAVSGELLPAIRGLHDFVAREYLTRTRQSIALGDLPLGVSWYAYRVRRAVGAERPAADIHRLGLAEVETLKTQLQGDAAATSGPVLPMSDLLNAYQQLSGEVAAHLEPVITGTPAAALEILATELWPEPGSSLYYLHAADYGKRPAVLFIDAAMPAATPALAGFLQHALPGMHLQNSMQRAAELPRFRRFNAEPAFVAGWGLYAASLGEELGLYAGAGQKSQLTALKLRCAVALVVDTGVHALHWTRAQAIDYVHAQLAVDDRQAQSIVDGYLAMPADALACGMGEFKIRALRIRSQQALGSRFEIREFHAQLLKDGSMPLDILDAKMKTWTESIR